MITPDDPRHGERAGYDAHRRADQEPCEPCRRAAAAYEAARTAERAAGVRRTVPVIGTSRRVQALVAIGYTFGQIGDALGVSHDSPQKLATARKDGVTRTSTAARVAQLYDRWAMRPAPERTPLERRNASYARRVAERNGWVSPLAWDDTAIDDPAARPVGLLRRRPADDDVDPVVIHRVMSGDRVPYATTAERIEIVARWTADGRSLRQLEILTGWKVERYLRAREAGRVA